MHTTDTTDRHEDHSSTDAFEAYVRRGESSGFNLLHRRELTGDDNGGFLVPLSTEDAINRAVAGISPIRSISSVQKIRTNLLMRQTTGGSAFFPTMELYAMPAMTEALLADPTVDIDRWFADEVRLAFAQQEGQSFVIGDGVDKPKGFLTYDTIDNDRRWERTIGVIRTGVDGAFPVVDPSAKLMELVYAAKPSYRANGSFVMNRSTQAVIRKMKGADGNYLWQPAAQPGGNATLLGFPVVESEDMPDIAANSLSVAFGDFRRGYLVVDRIGISVLRDPYSVKPYVLFYTTKRVGGGVQDFEAIKLLKFSA